MKTKTLLIITLSILIISVIAVASYYTLASNGMNIFQNKVYTKQLGDGLDPDPTIPTTTKITTTTEQTTTTRPSPTTTTLPTGITPNSTINRTEFTPDKVFNKLENNEGFAATAKFTINNTATKPLSIDTFKLNFKEVKGKVLNYNIRLFQTCNKTRTEEIPYIEEQCFETGEKDKNGSMIIKCQNVTLTNYTTSQYQEEDYCTTNEIPMGNHQYIIDADIQWSPCARGVCWKIDWIPQIEYETKLLQQNKWAWWEGNYTESMAINATNIPTGIPFIINNSGCFYINNTKQCVWARAENNLYVFYNNYTSYAVGTPTYKVSYEVSYGNTSSYNGSGVWYQNPTWDLRNVFHMEDATRTSKINNSVRTGQNLTVYSPYVNVTENGTVGKARGEFFGYASGSVNGLGSDIQDYTVFLTFKITHINFTHLQYIYGASNIAGSYFEEHIYTNRTDMFVECRRGSTYYIANAPYTLIANRTYYLTYTYRGTGDRNCTLYMNGQELVHTRYASSTGYGASASIHLGINPRDSTVRANKTIIDEVFTGFDNLNDTAILAMVKNFNRTSIGYGDVNTQAFSYNSTELTLPIYIEPEWNIEIDVNFTDYLKFIRYNNPPLNQMGAHILLVWGGSIINTYNTTLYKNYNITNAYYNINITSTSDYNSGDIIRIVDVNKTDLTDDTPSNESLWNLTHSYIIPTLSYANVSISTDTPIGLYNLSLGNQAINDILNVSLPRFIIGVGHGDTFTLRYSTNNTIQPPYLILENTCNLHDDNDLGDWNITTYCYFQNQNVTARGNIYGTSTGYIYLDNSTINLNKTGQAIVTVNIGGINNGRIIKI